MVKINWIVLTKVIIFFQSFCLTLFRSQLEYTDIVPFIFYEQTSLKNYGGPSPKEATIDYSSQNFKAVPQVIVGIIKYDNQFDPKNGISFELASDSITQTSCMVKVSEGIDSILFGITVSVLVIDTSQFPYINVIHAYKDNVFSGISTFSYEETIQFSSQIQKLSGTKRVEVFLRGWVSESYPLDRFTLQIKIDSISSNDYKIKISSNSQSQKITKVYYTIVEYISDANSIYGLISQQDIQYQSQPNTSCFYKTNCSNSVRYFPVNFNVKDISYPSLSLYKFFATINQLDFETKVVGQNPRIQLTNFKFKSSNQLTYDYNVWDGSTCFGSSSSSLFFYSKKCQQSNQKIQGDTCISSCINFDTSNPSLCLDCQGGQFYLQDKKTCQSNKPDGYSCQPEQSYQTCQNCNITNCIDCELKSNSFVCTKCSSGYYLYNGNCTIIQPDNTYCDINNLVCSQCSDSTCKTCENPSTNPQLCLSCLSNYYFLNGKCSQNQPEGTYCSGYNCQMCSNQACLSCTDPTSSPQKCVTCKQTDYFYNGQCFSNQPDNTYCDTLNKKCVACSEQTCKYCGNESTINQFACTQCSTGYYLYSNKCYSKDKLQDNLYCNSADYKCQKCNNPLCKQCKSDLSSCISCLNSLKLAEENCRCKDTGHYYDQTKNICIQCSNSTCIECYNNPNQCSTCGKNAIIDQSTQSCQCEPSYYYNELKICSKCASNQKVEKINGIYQCVCKESSQYYNSNIQDCTICKIPNCEKCSQDGNSCQKCLDGFIYKDQTKQTCRYCGNGYFSNDQLLCLNKCQQDCILCSNNQTCDRFTDDHIYSEKDCHFSCSKCRIPNNKYDCVECSSPTRIHDRIIGSCNCKSGYIETDTKDCKKDNTVYPSDSLQTASTNLVKISYLMYFPQLFINIHPFADSFIFSMQQIGNIYFLLPDSSIIPYKSLTILNFFNIFYQSSENEEYSAQLVLGIKYKSVIDEQISYNLIILAFILLIFSILAIFIFVFRYKITRKFVLTNLQWNTQMKLIRLSSNYFLVNISLNLTKFSKFNPISSAILGLLIAIYLYNLMICFKKSQYVDQDNFKYLYANLNTQIKFNRFFWIILELKKILLVLCLSFISVKLYPIILIGCSFLFALLLSKFKPHENCLRDCVYLIISELFIIILSIFPLVIQQTNEHSEQTQMINYANLTVIAYIIFQILVTVEYAVRMLIIYRKKINASKFKSYSQQPIVLDMSHEINFEKLDDFLNQSQRFGNSIFKKKKTTIGTTKSTISSY